MRTLKLTRAAIYRELQLSGLSAGLCVFLCLAVWSPVKDRDSSANREAARTAVPTSDVTVPTSLAQHNETGLATLNESATVPTLREVPTEGGCGLESNNPSRDR